MLNDSAHRDKIRLDGYYNNVTEATYKKGKGEKYYKEGIYVDEYRRSDSVVTSPIYFFGNGLLVQDCLTATLKDYINIIKSEDPKKLLHGSFRGTYKITGDTIQALIYLTVYNRISPRFAHPLAYYRGIIKNSDTIVDWRIVKPYPKLYDGTEQLDLKPCTLVFTKFNEKKLIDSSMTWINKYK